MYTAPKEQLLIMIIAIKWLIVGEMVLLAALHNTRHPKAVYADFNPPPTDGC